MDSATLVTDDIRRGRHILRQLKDTGMKLYAAAWRHDAGRESWRLVLASDEVLSGSRGVRMRAAEALAPSDLLSIDFVSPDDGFVRAASKAYGVPQTFGKRVTNTLIDGRYIDDAFVYSL